MKLLQLIPVFKPFLQRCHFSNVRTFSVDFSQFLVNASVNQFLDLLGKSQCLLEKENISIVKLVNQRKKIENELKSLIEIQDDDKDMVKLVIEEKTKFLESINEINKEILLELLPTFEEDRHVMIEVTAGVGGKEAMHFASELFDMYSNYSLFKRWKWELQECDQPETGGIRHGSAFVSGQGVALRLLQETGVHRVQRVPATEKSGRVHTSTVSVAVLPQPTEVEVVINDKDIKMETKTSSGAGGQHVNKTESCVRITHLPTGIVIENQTDRSQIQNRKIALQRLRSKLYQMQLDQFQSEMHSSRKEQVGLSLRSEKIRTYNFNQDRVTDHRLGMTLHNLPRFLEGGHELDQLIMQLIRNSKEQELLRIVEERLQAVATKETKVRHLCSFGL